MNLLSYLPFSKKTLQNYFYEFVILFQAKADQTVSEFGKFTKKSTIYGSVFYMRDLTLFRMGGEGAKRPPLPVFPI